MLEKILNRIIARSMVNSVHKWQSNAKKEVIQFRKNHPSKFAEIKILSEKLKKVIEQDGICDEALELHDQIFDLWSGGYFTDYFVYASVFYDGFYSPKEKLTKEDAARLWTVRAKNISYREQFETDLQHDYKNLMQKIFYSFDNHADLQINFIKKLFAKGFVLLSMADKQPLERPSVFMKFLESSKLNTDTDEYEHEDNDDIYKPKKIFQENFDREEKFYILRELCNVLNIKLDFDSINIAAAEEKVDEYFATSHISDEQIVKVHKVARKAFLREKILMNISDAHFSFWKDFFEALPMTVRNEVFGAA